MVISMPKFFREPPQVPVSQPNRSEQLSPLFRECPILKSQDYFVLLHSWALALLVKTTPAGSAGGEARVLRAQGSAIVL